MDQAAVPSDAVETMEQPNKEPSNVPTKVPSPTQADAPVDVEDNDVLVPALEPKSTEEESDNEVGNGDCEDATLQACYDHVIVSCCS